MSIEEIVKRIPKDEGWFRAVCVSEGWWPIVIELDNAIAELAPDYKVLQVKEKFGGLRYYVSYEGLDGPTIEKINELIAKAETKSYETCERCGEAGKLRSSHYWHLTLCDSCNEKRDKEIEKEKSSSQQ